MSNKKINNVCVIDDDLIYQYVAKEEIAHTNLVKNVLFFEDGEQAIHFLTTTLESDDTSSLPDIIFLDINMPIMDGWEFLEAYLLLQPRIEKNITIYVVSSSMIMRDIDKARHISVVTDYIIKPITNNRLLNIFTSFLG